MSVAYQVDPTEFELFHAVPVPLAVTEANGAIIFANSEFEDLVNIDQNIILGMCIENLFPSVQKNKIKAALAIASKQTENFRLKQQTLFIRRKSRRQVMVDVSIAKYETQQRSVMVFSFSDLSEFQSQQSD